MINFEHLECKYTKGKIITAILNEPSECHEYTNEEIITASIAHGMQCWYGVGAPRAQY